ncbi:unnamed protein product [Arabidopsis lyrata]|nr:unnamed protein product [Arabidopsis lyrata]
MMSVERSEVVDDVFFDSSDVLSIGEQVKEEEEEAEFQVWSGEPVSVEERRVRFLKKMGLLEERFESMYLERMISDYSDEVTTSSSSDSYLCDSELQCCVREENYGSTTSMSDEELEGEDDDESEENSTDVCSSPSRSFSKKSAKKWFFNCFVGVKDKDFKYKSSEATMSKVKVKTNKKSHVELSAAYMVQKINGHKGKIWVLKFSPDELYGHTGDVLDLAWSDSNLLLSASKDKTARLWRIGCDQCLHVFHHNNYVTCVEFNPVNKNNFLSGSIDGKARIWGLSEERVVAWTDVRDSISAICYQPNGNGFVVGCITGNCRFYQISGNDVIMDEQILSRGRNNITAVEFCPGSSEKLMVSTDESKVRIFNKTQIFHKFKAPSKYGKQSSASFVSSTGKHILSVRRGLGVYLWNNDGFPSRKGAKSSRSFEYFHSPGVSAAAAWTPPGAKVSKTAGDDEESRRALRQIQSSGKLSRSCRVTATWPVEKLLMSSSDVGIYDNTIPWRLVIVTASLDGMIRTFHNYGLPRRL